MQSPLAILQQSCPVLLATACYELPLMYRYAQEAVAHLQHVIACPNATAPVPWSLLALLPPPLAPGLSFLCCSPPSLSFSLLPSFSPRPALAPFSSTQATGCVTSACLLSHVLLLVSSDMHQGSFAWINRQHTHIAGHSLLCTLTHVPSMPVRLSSPACHGALLRIVRAFQDLTADSYYRIAFHTSSADSARYPLLRIVRAFQNLTADSCYRMAVHTSSVGSTRYTPLSLLPLTEHRYTWIQNLARAGLQRHPCCLLMLNGQLSQKRMQQKLRLSRHRFNTCSTPELASHLRSKQFGINGWPTCCTPFDRGKRDQHQGRHWHCMSFAPSARGLSRSYSTGTSLFVLASTKEAALSCQGPAASLAISVSTPSQVSQRSLATALLPEVWRFTAQLPLTFCPFFVQFFFLAIFGGFFEPSLLLLWQVFLSPSALCHAPMSSSCALRHFASLDSSLCDKISSHVCSSLRSPFMYACHLSQAGLALGKWVAHCASVLPFTFAPCEGLRHLLSLDSSLPTATPRLRHPSAACRIGEASHPGPDSLDSFRDLFEDFNRHSDEEMHPSSSCPPLGRSRADSPPLAAAGRAYADILGTKDLPLDLHLANGRPASLRCNYMHRAHSWRWGLGTQPQRLVHESVLANAPPCRSGWAFIGDTFLTWALLKFRRPWTLCLRHLLLILRAPPIPLLLRELLLALLHLFLGLLIQFLSLRQRT